MRFCLILITALLLAGCSHHKAPPPNARLSDSITVIAGLNDQLQSWHGTPYRYGGMTRRGVDCSGFVVVTMRDRFDLQLPRETKQQASIGTQIDKDELLPGDLVFFKTGSGQNGLHVGIYDMQIGYFAQNQAQLLDENLTIFQTIDFVVTLNAESEMLMLSIFAMLF